MNAYSSNRPCTECGLVGWVDVNNHSKTFGLCMTCRGVGGNMTTQAMVLKQEDRTELAREKIDAAEALDTIRTFAITTREDLDMASEILLDVKGKLKWLEEKRLSITRPINEGLDAIRSLFRAPEAHYAECEKALKGKIAAYHAEQVARNQAAMAAAAAANLNGDRAGVTAALSVVGTPDKAAGVSVREAWDFEVVNEQLVPREYLLVDHVRIRKDMQHSASQDGSPMPIPGVRFFTKAVVTARAT